MSKMAYEKTMALISNSAATLQSSALQAASPIVLALMECDQELREEAIGLFKDIASGERFATAALLAEILFPNADHKSLPGLDLAEAEEIACEISPEAKDVLAEMDKEEAIFADRLRSLMTKKGFTQAQLAEKLGVGQPAISMMLQRDCRPQKRPIIRLAEVLGVQAEELWPKIKDR
jgi:lambda repressor-like predicted transcriptional regulator